MEGSLPSFSVHAILQQEYQSGLPCPPPRDLPNPWIEPALTSALASGFFLPLAPPGKPIRSVSRFFYFFFHVDVQLFQHHLLKRLLFSPLYYLCCFVKDQLIVFMWVYLWTLYSVPLIYLYIFTNITIFLSIALSLLEVELLDLFFSLNIVLAILCIFPLYINFIIIF